MAWKKSEIETKNYIIKNISEWSKINPEFKKISTKYKGGSDSKAKDLEIWKNNKNIFNVEIKENVFQIAPFVIIPNHIKKKFFLGDVKGKKNIERTREINEYMNENFDNYKKPTKKGLILKCSDEMMYKCIDGFLEYRNDRYIACKINNNFKIIHYKQFRNFFPVRAKYRNKQSGSSNPAKKSFNILVKYVKDNFDSKDIKFTKDEKFLFKSQINNLFGNKFLIDGDKYFISKKKYNDFYRITKTSKTDSETVLFEISMKNQNKKDNINLFKKDLIKND